jgi:hypothetical protein
MRQRSTKALYAHWNELKAGGPIPDRNDLDPSAIGEFLQDVFILGADAHGVWRYRVAGTRLSSFARRELRDEPFDRWWRAADRPDSARMVSGVAADGAPLVGGVRGFGPEGLNHDFEMVLLPLRHGGRPGQRLLGAFFPANLPVLPLSFFAEEIALLSVRAVETPSGQRIFGQPNPDLMAALDRRRAFRVIEGGTVN